MPHKDPAKRRAYNQHWERTHPGYRRAWEQAHPHRRNSWMKTYRDQLKVQVFQIYGGPICVCCGETHFEFLSLDHTYGNGAKHRSQLKKEGSYEGSNFYIWLKKHSFPPGFRVLCMNCNFALGNFGYCPHGNLKETPQPFFETDLGRPAQDALGSVPITAHPGGNGSGEGRQLNLRGFGDNAGDGT